MTEAGDGPATKIPSDSVLVRTFRVVLCVSVCLAGCRSRPQPVTTELWFGGDVHASGRLRALLDPVPLNTAAVGVVNLEGPIADGAAATADASGVHLRQALRTPALLRNAGVGIATLENNHALDLGEQGRSDTVRRLREAGIEAVQRATLPVLPGGAPISVLAFDLSAGLPPELGSVVSRCTGLCVVSFHVTQKPSYLPAEVLVHAVDVALGAGARIVVAHGSHEPARVERRGDAVIAWGLGNLVFDCECTRETDALVLSVGVSPDGALDAAVLPMHAGLDGEPARPSDDPDSMADLLVSLRSSPIRRDGPWLRF
jgi:hypothetical protein